jgi:hypothetical protein
MRKAEAFARILPYFDLNIAENAARRTLQQSATHNKFIGSVWTNRSSSVLPVIRVIIFLRDVVSCECAHMS